MSKTELKITDIFLYKLTVDPGGKAEFLKKVFEAIPLDPKDVWSRGHPNSFLVRINGIPRRLGKEDIGIITTKEHPVGPVIESKIWLFEPDNNAHNMLVKHTLTYLDQKSKILREIHNNFKENKSKWEILHLT